MTPGHQSRHQSLIGQRVDRYEVLAALGQGGFGAVYRARHTLLGTEIALKVLRPELGNDASIVTRFLHEARAAASIGNPHIARVLDAGRTDEGLVFLAMELLAGRDLERELEERRRIPTEEAVPIMRQVLEAVAAAHAAGIVHRDLKPANIFLVPGPDRTPLVKLLDFGIAKSAGGARMTRTGVLVGTPQYMAPEQLEGREADARVDVYAAGVVFYEMLTGRLPIEGAGVDVLVRRASGEVPPMVRALAPEVPESIAFVVQRALAFRPDARWPSASAMGEALAAAAVPRGEAPTLSPGASAGMGNAATMPATPVASYAHPPSSASVSPHLSSGSGWPGAESMPSHRAGVGASTPASGGGWQPGSESAPPPSHRAGVGASTPASGGGWQPGSESAPPPSHRAGVGASTPASGWQPSRHAATVGLPSETGPLAQAWPSGVSPQPVAGPGWQTPAHPSAPPAGGWPATPQDRRGPVSSGRSPFPLWIVAAVGAFALLAVGVGIAVALGIRHRTERPSAPSNPAVPTSRPVPPVIDPPTETVAAPEPSPDASGDPAAVDPAAVDPAATPPAADPNPAPPRRGIDPADIRFRLVQVVGTAPRPELDRLLERSRRSVADCAEGRPLHLAVMFIATWGGNISIARPSDRRPSDDRRAAACVATAVQGAGPIATSGGQSAVVELDVELPAR